LIFLSDLVPDFFFNLPFRGLSCFFFSYGNTGVFSVPLPLFFFSSGYFHFEVLKCPLIFRYWGVGNFGSFAVLLVWAVFFFLASSLNRLLECEDGFLRGTPSDMGPPQTGFRAFFLSFFSHGRMIFLSILQFSPRYTRHLFHSLAGASF